jgi:hypothetical protein
MRNLTPKAEDLTYGIGFTRVHAYGTTERIPLVDVYLPPAEPSNPEAPANPYDDFDPLYVKPRQELELP